MLGNPRTPETSSKAAAHHTSHPHDTMFSYGRTRIRAEFQQQSCWIPVGPGVHSGLLLHFEEKVFCYLISFVMQVI